MYSGLPQPRHLFLVFEIFVIYFFLGTGTFGRVMLVKEKSTKDFFALKVMKKSKIVALKQVQHVQNEKQILLSIKHPFIIQL